MKIMKCKLFAFSRSECQQDVWYVYGVPEKMQFWLRKLSLLWLNMADNRNCAAT